MSYHVTLETGSIARSVGTDGAHEGLLPRVSPNMPLEVGRDASRVAAILARLLGEGLRHLFRGNLQHLLRGLPGNALPILGGILLSATVYLQTVNVASLNFPISSKVTIMDLMNHIYVVQQLTV